MPTSVATELLRYDPTNNVVVPVKEKSSRRSHRPQEYTTKKKVEVKTTTNTERRIQRQVVLEDGRVLAKNEPEIIVDKVEDMETKETEHSPEELPDSLIKRLNLGASSGKQVVRDSFQRTVNTRDVTENVHSTRVSKDLGLISKKALRKAMKSKEVTPDDLIRRSEAPTRNNDRRRELINPRETKTTTYKAESRKKIIDTTDVHDVSHLENGKIKSETIKTETHEIFDDRRIPSDGSSLSGSKPSLRANDVQKYSVKKRENYTDYYRPGIAKDEPMIKVGSGPNVTSEDRNIHRGITHDWTKMEEKIRRNRRIMNIDGNSRADVVTKKPLNYAHEEKNRRTETDKWLDTHFGSDWSLTTSSGCSPQKKKPGGSTTIRRTMSFSSVHNPNMSRLVKQTTKTIDPVSGEEKITYATMSRIDPAVNTSTLSLPITRVDIGSSSEGSNTQKHIYQNEKEMREQHRREISSPPLRVPHQYHYISKETDNSVGSTYVTNFRAAPKAISTSSSGSEKNNNNPKVRTVSIEVQSQNSPPLVHDRIQRLRTEHSSRSRIKKVTPSSVRRRSDEEDHRHHRGRNMEESKSISSSTSHLHQITEVNNVANTRSSYPVERAKYRSKSSQPLYRTELRREQFYPIVEHNQIEQRPTELQVKILPTSSSPPQFISQNSTTKYIQIQPKSIDRTLDAPKSLDRNNLETPKSYRSLERTDGRESPSAIHNIPLRKFVSEERNHYYYDRKNEFIHSTPLKKAMSKPSGLDQIKPTHFTVPPSNNRRRQFREQYLLESQTPLRNHLPGAQYMSPRKHMERSESEQTHRYQTSSTMHRTSRSMSNRPKYPEPPLVETVPRKAKKLPRGRSSGDRKHSFLVKTASGGSSGGGGGDPSRKVYHEHPLVEAEVHRLDNSGNENLVHTRNLGGSGGGGGGVWSGLLGKLSPHRRSVSTAKLNQITANHPLSKFGGSARDLYFASPTASPTSLQDPQDPQKFKTIIFLSGK
eukprot:TRINITY_DN3479_c0_g1_i1.p1 TRINITY_DN3479_c0_g1~~TRINITY_DN3479_c0_g1_i1.p1  ORF type:complete len:987 (+),score=195.31 TRINITY_DN3479_c0_g1_i1:184-3144(+)